MPSMNMKVLSRRLLERTTAAPRKPKSRIVATDRTIVFIRADFRHPVKRHLRTWRGLFEVDLVLKIVNVAVDIC